MYWADINIDSQGTKGRIQIASDYGSYQNYWGACGCDFKKFLIGLNIEYAADKFEADRWFDHDATIRDFKYSVLEERRFENITSKKAREIYDEIETLKDYTDKESFGSQMWNCSELMRLYDHCPDIKTGISPLFRKFWDGPWQIFISNIK